MFKREWMAPLGIVLALTVGASATQAGPLKPDVLDSDNLAWFYNRPGVHLEQFREDLGACAAFGRSMSGSNDPDGGMAYGLVGAIMRDIAVRGPNVAYTDDCLMIKGYRRFNIAGGRQKAFAAKFEALPAEAQALYISSDNPPEGVLSRQWANSYWLPKAGETVDAETLPNFIPSAPDVPTYNRWGQPKNAKAGARGTVGQAVVMITVYNPQSSGAIVQFDRRTASGAADLVFDGKKQVWVGFEATAPKGASAPVVQTFVIPAGTYALAMARTGRYDFTSFCLGTVAFTVQPGDIVDLGDVTMVESKTQVDSLAPAPLVQLRIDQPEADSARAAVLGITGEPFRQASYVNGFPRMCPLFARIYGFSLPGAPQWTAP